MRPQLSHSTQAHEPTFLQPAHGGWLSWRRPATASVWHAARRRSGINWTRNQQLCMYVPEFENSFGGHFSSLNTSGLTDELRWSDIMVSGRALPIDLPLPVRRCKIVLRCLSYARQLFALGMFSQFECPRSAPEIILRISKKWNALSLPRKV